ncbi:MAG: hypothetical protein ACYC56_05555 [Candidatus Aquicultor sp.]
MGIQDLVRSLVAFHIVMERLYFNQTKTPVLWERLANSAELKFNKDSSIFIWAERLGEEILETYPPNERKEEFYYDDQGYKTK